MNYEHNLRCMYFVRCSELYILAVLYSSAATLIWFVVMKVWTDAVITDLACSRNPYLDKTHV